MKKPESKAAQYFGLDEQQQICKAVHRAEAKTSGELVPMLVGESHSYPLAAIRGASIISLLLALLCTPFVASMFWLPGSSVWVFLCFFFPFFGLFSWLIQRNVWLKRFFLFPDEMDAEVQNAAFTAFFEEKLYKTRDANGILIYISLLEHRAWILADSGIDERIETAKWDEAVQVIIKGVKEEQSCAALCKAIDMIGTILEQEFPIREDDQNELHDLIIR